MSPRRAAAAAPPTARRLRSPGRRLLAVVSALAVVATSLVIATRDPQRAAAAPSYSPYGKVEQLGKRPGGMVVRGWAIDPSAPTTALTVYTTIDGKRSTAATANLLRSDVAAAHPGTGSNHGFGFTVLVGEGNHTVCLWAGDLGVGSDTRLGCRTTSFNYSPVGQVDYVRTGHGTLSIKGWAFDGDALTTALPVWVTVDGLGTNLTASQNNSEAAKAWPSAGVAHGYSTTVAVAQGPHRVCISATNLGYGQDTSFGCRTVTLDEGPTGAVDFLARSGGGLRVRGWSYDVDSPAKPLSVVLMIDKWSKTFTANRTRTDVAAKSAAAGGAHGFDVTETPGEGKHHVVVVARNLDLGSDRVLADKWVTLNFTPTASLVTLTTNASNAHLQGWAVDPDTSKPIPVRLTVDGATARTVTANAKGPKNATNAGRNFDQWLPMVSGTHSVCAVGVNVAWGHSDSRPSCRSVTFAISPFGKYESATRDTATGGIKISGWAYDPDTTAPLAVAVTLDGKYLPDLRASAARADVAKTYPGAGSAHGISTVLPASAGEHTICLSARNVSGGKNLVLGCKIVFAVHPVAPSAPRSVKATGSYQAGVVSWTRPASDGGAPAGYVVVTAHPGNRSVRVAGNATSATVTGLAQKAKYSFTVAAVSFAGTSPSASSATITTLSGPAPQKTTPPVATSRYIRNIRGSSASELARMRAEGVADAKANPSNHRYLVLLDIGGQDQYDGGVVLSATTRFVSYGDLVRDVNAYVDGYHSAQRGTAPVTIALGTNNDMDVSSTSGAAWATSVVNPVAGHARNYAGMSIAGANDIEPGFRASYSQTRSWLSGYLARTSRPFVFNGSADGCAWTTTNRGCNNGWSMSGLYTLAAGAAPTRSINLPQIYNTTMSAQWKYISLTGVGKRQPRINFGGPLTELTACRQSGGCGSLSGRSAWSTMWHDLQSDSRLRVSSLPYATDLRVDW